jgi:DNA-directed RNA polymerase specialized sigma24 family protein
MTLAEAADVLGIPEGTVKSRMFHARKALAKVLT